eukprot:5830885-Amphidinium_carterae.1
MSACIAGSPESPAKRFGRGAEGAVGVSSGQQRVIIRRCRSQIDGLAVSVSLRLAKDTLFLTRLLL